MTVPIVEPKMISWACERSGYDRELLEHKFKKLPEWERGTRVPTQNQLTQFANTVHVPYGFLFLDQPPDESIQIQDFRTLKGKKITRPSPNLVDIIEAAEVRQDWYREYALAENLPKVEFVGMADINSSHSKYANKLQELLKFKISDRSQLAENEDILQLLTERMGDLGILVMVSGIVDSNTRRKLELEEFRGFALCDEYAPLIFLNARDSKPAQLYTLAHELGHLVLGSTGLTNIGIGTSNDLKKDELWCNKFAAEFLVPRSSLSKQLTQFESIDNSIDQMADYYRVSRLVVLRRLLDIGVISSKEFGNRMKMYFGQRRKVASTKTLGGNFYSITLKRVSRSFSTAVIVNTLEGKTNYKEALELLGITTLKAFDGLAKELGVKESGVIESKN